MCFLCFVIKLRLMGVGKGLYFDSLGGTGVGCYFVVYVVFYLT